MSETGGRPRRRKPAENEALVLKVLRRSRRPVSAYDVLEVLSRSGHRLLPNQIYRTLARLIEQQTIVRLETLKAYLPSAGPADLCLICQRCQAIVFTEAPAVTACLRAILDKVNFHSSERPLEVLGLCRDCQTASDTREKIVGESGVGPGGIH